MTFVGEQLAMFPGQLVEVPEDEAVPVRLGVWPMDCANPDGLRPCPVVRCRHHLLLDEVYSGPGEPSLAINRAGATVQLRGRRRELAPDANRAEVDAFADEAVAALLRLPDTCSREVAQRAREARPDGFEAMTFEELAVPLGAADPDELAEECAAILDAVRGEVYAAGGEDIDAIVTNTGGGWRGG